MKFTIEVEEFWIEDGELADALHKHIKDSVVSKISKNISAQVEKQIVLKVNEIMDKKMTTVIDQVLSDLVDKQTIMRDGEDILIADHLKRQFQRNHGWNSPDEKMERIAKEFGNQLKLQYNNMFANKIVLNMKAQGLLKDEVVQILLGGEK